jgi:hypothetical protein
MHKVTVTSRGDLNFLVYSNPRSLYNIYSVFLRISALLTRSSAIFLGLTAFLCFLFFSFHSGRVLHSTTAWPCHSDDKGGRRRGLYSNVSRLLITWTNVPRDSPLKQSRQPATRGMLVRSQYTLCLIGALFGALSLASGPSGECSDRKAPKYSSFQLEYTWLGCSLLCDMIFGDF